MDAQLIQSNLQRWLIWKSRYFCAGIEIGVPYGKADVFGVNASHFSHEFEVKTSKQDLRGELISIQIQKEGRLFTDAEDEYRRRDKAKKLSKHNLYLQRSFNTNAPNLFSFVVTEDLVDFALQTLAGTPYGLMVASVAGRIYSEYEGVELVFRTLKRPKKLHEEKFKNFKRLLREITLDNANVHRRLLELRRSHKGA